MSNTVFYIILFLLLPFGVFFLLSWLVSYHLGAYGLKGSFSKRAKHIFLLGMVIVSLMIVVQFILIDWKELPPEELFQTFFISIPSQK